MCGRFTLAAPGEALVELFRLMEAPEVSPRYNIAPTQMVAVIREVVEPRGRELAWMKWGLIPSWANDPRMGGRLINARSETAAEKPTFRSAFRHRRCLIPADGFYEWQTVDGKKRAYYIRMQDGEPFAFAGLWEEWRKTPEEPVVSCTILTTDANPLLRPLHERMPVILDPVQYDPWLDPDEKNPDVVKALLRPFPAEAMTTYPVGPLVNSPRNDLPECREAAKGAAL